jgi:hypothetical protein
MKANDFIVGCTAASVLQQLWSAAQTMMIANKAGCFACVWHVLFLSHQYVRVHPSCKVFLGLT